jgi:MFS family permease
MAFRARVAITAVFALNGTLFASIFSRLPAIQDRAGLGDGTLGLALLCSMLGLVVAQFAAGALVARIGSRRLVVVGALGYAAGLIPVALSESFAALAVSLAFIGVANGVLDVSMNIHGLTVERRLGRPILSTLHAAFSFGALAGAVVGALVAAAGVGVTAHLAGMALLGAVAAPTAGRFLLPSSADAAPEGPLIARPSRALLAIGVFAFCVLLAEGAVNDWAAIYLDDEIGTGEALAASGLAAFSLTMGVGRLFGDRLVERLGPVALARGGASLSLAGMAVVLSASGPLLAIPGFAVMGLGLAALFPLALRAAAARGPVAGPSVAAVSAFGYLGLLTGPPAVGGLSELVGLRAGLAIVVALLAVAALLAGSLRAPRAAARAAERVR